MLLQCFDPPALPDTDAALAKMKLNWRTALILAELELEIEALAQGRQHRKQLKVGTGKRELQGARITACMSSCWQVSQWK